MLNRKWIAGAVLAAFLTVGVGTGTPQAYAGERGPAVKITAAETVELAKHHRDRGPKHIDRRDHGPKKISHHRGHRPPAHRPPPHRPHRSHDSGSSIVGGIIGGIIGGILVNGSD